MGLSQLGCGFGRGAACISLFSFGIPPSSKGIAPRRMSWEASRHVGRKRVATRWEETRLGGNAFGGKRVATRLEGTRRDVFGGNAFGWGT